VLETLPSIMTSGVFVRLAFRLRIIPVLLSMSLAAPALPQLASRGLSFGAATALEGKGATESGAHSAVLSISSKTPKQGQVVEVTVANLSPASDSASQTTTGSNASASGNINPLPLLEVLGKKYKFFPDKSGDGKTYRALFAVPVVQKPGTYNVVVGQLNALITVQDAHFQVQRLNLPKSKDNFITAPGEEEAVDKAKATLSAERFWTGKFDKPSHARQSAPFGIRRIVNGKLLPDYFHSGLDFAAGLGSPIYATAPGTVVLAQGGGVFKLHGNMVAIDHGQGVVSFYIHMHKVLVKVGQVVRQDDQIGLVGQTGRANGPHLHFSIYVNQVASSPSQWFAGVSGTTSAK
jgi:murein DD-endopeptidase MepM/ murein hydrolase activator NlpD